jgi:HPt (histidine-containing phosphotransfer) domain-containing protein
MELPLIDLDRLDSVSGGDAILARELLDDLITESDAILIRLRAAVGANDGSALPELAHVIKGMALELGVPRLQANAVALEREAEPGLWEQRVRNVSASLDELRLRPTT